MSIIDLMTIENMRGDREILHTQTFLLNDSEEVRWRVMIDDTLLSLLIKFTPTETININPPIKIDTTGKDTVIEFIGWIGNTTYRIDVPVNICKIKNSFISFSVVNMHLGNSNKCDIQLYRECKFK